MPEEGQQGTEEHYSGAVLIQVCPGIALLIARVGKATEVVCQHRNIPLFVDSLAAFVVVRLFADLAIGAVALVAGEIFANVAVIAVVVAAVLAVVFVSVVAFVSTAAGSGLNAVLAVVAVPVVIEQVVATVVEAEVFVGVLAAVFADYGGSFSGFAAAEFAAAAAEFAAAAVVEVAVVVEVAAAEVAAAFYFGNLFGCCSQNSHFARFCYHGIPDNSLLPSFA